MTVAVLFHFGPTLDLHFAHWPDGISGQEKGGAEEGATLMGFPRAGS